MAFSTSAPLRYGRAHRLIGSSDVYSIRTQNDCWCPSTALVAGCVSTIRALEFARASGTPSDNVTVAGSTNTRHMSANIEVHLEAVRHLVEEQEPILKLSTLAHAGRRIAPGGAGEQPCARLAGLAPMRCA